MAHWTQEVLPEREKMQSVGARRYDEIIRLLLERLSVYLIPSVIGITTLIALVFWNSQYAAGEGEGLNIRFVVDPSVEGLSPAQAIKLLDAVPAETHHDTRLSEHPVWFQFSIPADASDKDVIEFPSRHATDIVCWNSATLGLIGKVSRESAIGPMYAARTGFVLADQNLIGQSVVCRAYFSGPARLTVKLWDGGLFASSILAFHRDSGLIEGGLGILSLFVLITAIVNREWIYIVFAAWLTVNLRLAAISAGWDIEWFGRQLPVDWLPMTRKLTVSFYYVLTVTLFSWLFRDDLKRISHNWLLRWNQWTCIPMLVIAFLPTAWFVPTMWVMTGIAGSIIVFLLSRILFVTRSRVAVWFSVSLAIAVFSGFSEVVAAALGLKTAVSIINSVTAALFSSLMAALAIAQQMRDERLERRRAETALRNTYQEIPIGLFTLDHSGCILRGNPTLGGMLGNEIHDGIHAWSDYFGQEHWKHLADAVRTGQAVEMELRDLHLLDADKWYLLRAKQTGECIEGSLQDISERVKATEKLTFMADHDPLTGTFNRRGIEKSLSDAIVDASPASRCLLAYLDLDRFKLINDLYGHGTGDETLRQICRRIEPLLGKADFLGRIGGDEFIVVLRRAALGDAAECCRQLIEAIEGSTFNIEDKAFRVGGCIGLVEAGKDITVADAIAGADRACREAKKGSGGRLVVYEVNSPAFNEREHELHILKRFGVDAPPEGLFLVMQPIMSLRAPYESLNFEVLLRMYRPDNSIESAWRIINTAEKNGRIALIDRWVLRQVLEWLDTHFDTLDRTRFVSVNLSGGSLNDERFVEDAFSLVAEHPRSASRICFEITESVAVSDIENTLRFVNRVRDFGAKVALDDFGVGYTSFSYLHSLSADVLKIDGSLVSAALAHPANMSIIEAIANLSSNLGMTSIAEWAGDLDTVKAMVEVGIDYVQSYAVGRPQMPESILTARSSADFIQDKSIEEYVRKCLAGSESEDLWPQPGLLRPQDLH